MSHMSKTVRSYERVYCWNMAYTT